MPAAVVVLLAGGLVANYWPQPPPAPVPGNGPVAAADEPWVVAIADVRHADVPSGKSCVGTLVAPDAVVTAAHCVARREPSALSVVAGRTDLRTGDGRTVAVADIWTAPGYPSHDAPLDGLTRPLDGPPDIGVLLLADALPYRTLPMAGPARAAPPGGTVARLTGWRVSVADEPVLWQSPTTVRDDARCRDVAAGARHWFPVPVLHGYRYDPAAYLCAGGGDRSVPARPSDSGAPLVVDGHLVGVNAWGPATDPLAAQFYSRVGTWSGEIARLVAEAGDSGHLPR